MNDMKFFRLEQIKNKIEFLRTNFFGFLLLQLKKNVSILFEFSPLHGYEINQNVLGLIVSHVARSRREFCVALDDFVDSFEEILLGCDLASGSDGEHSCFSTDRANFSAGGVGAETGEQFKTDVTFHRH